MQGYIIQSSYKTTGEGVLLKFFGRLKNGKSFLATTKYEPYFFVQSKHAKKAKGQECVTKVEKSDFKDFQGNSLSKVFTDVPSDVPEARHNLKQDGVKAYEADIRFTNRFLIDHNTGMAINIEGKEKKGERTDIIIEDAIITPTDFQPTLKVLSLDIETNRTASKIFSIAVYQGDYHKVFTPKKMGFKEEVVCKNEKEMLEKFQLSIQENDPDVITGWNLIDFDLNVLKKRFNHYKLKFDLGRDEGESELRIQASFFQSSRARIIGRVALDGLQLLRASFISLPNYKLDTAAQVILGEKKLIEFEDSKKGKGEQIEEMFAKGDKKLLEYNLKDAKLVLDILDKSGALNLALTRSLLANIEIDQVDGSIASLDSLYLRELKKLKIVAPSSEHGERSARITGGYVMDSKPGIYDTIAVLDFKSLYPSIMMTFNIDPLNFVGKKTTKDKNKFITAPNGAVFKNEEGILPKIIKNILEQRDVAKKRGDELERYALKILMNSFFGVLANPTCRFYSLDMANAITHFGQYLIKDAAKQIEKKGFEVIYSDTDSLFINIKTKDYKKAEIIGKKIAKDLNGYYHKKIKKDYSRDSKLDLEFEKVYLKFLMPQVRGATAGAKKRYAGLLKKGSKEEIEFVGLESVRRDWTDLAKTFQNELYNKIFHDKEVTAYIKKFVKDLKDGKKDDLLVYTKAIRKPVNQYIKTTPPHIKAARKSNIKGPGLIEYVITTDGPEEVNSIKNEIDYEHYIKKQVKPIADSILLFFDTDFDKLTSEGKQGSLFDY